MLLAGIKRSFTSLFYYLNWEVERRENTYISYIINAEVKNRRKLLQREVIMVDDFIKIIDAIKAYGVFPAVVAILIVIVLAGVGYLITTKTAQKVSGAKDAPEKKGIFARWEERRYLAAEKTLRKHGNLEPMVFKDMLLRNQMLDFMNNPSWKTHGPPSRIVLFSYHNGGHYVGGDYMSKMSLRVQVQNKDSFLGELAGDDVVRGLFRIDFPLLYEKLLQQGHFHITNVQSIRHDDPKLYSLLSRSGLNSAYIQQLKDDDGQPCGFLLIGYSEPPKDQDYVVQKLAIFAGYLSSTLSLSLVELTQMFKDATIKDNDKISN